MKELPMSDAQQPTANDAILADAYCTAEEFLDFSDRVYSDDQRRQVNALAREIAERRGWKPVGATVMVEHANAG
jgi:hypothetical protein